MSSVKLYKVSVQRTIAFLYTNNEAAEREIKETILFTVEPEIINLTKEV